MDTLTSWADAVAGDDMDFPDDERSEDDPPEWEDTDSGASCIICGVYATDHYEESFAHQFIGLD